MRTSASWLHRPRLLSADPTCRRMAAQLTGLKLLRFECQRLAAAKRFPSAGAQVRWPWSLCTATPPVPSDSEPWLTRGLVFGGDCRPSGVGERLKWGVCWLTFELRGRNRHGAWPAGRMMYHSGKRAKCHAGGGPWLERRVSQHPWWRTVPAPSRWKPRFELGAVAADALCGELEPARLVQP